jgi:hypothetical protein
VKEKPMLGDKVEFLKTDVSLEIGQHLEKDIEKVKAQCM